MRCVVPLLLAAAGGLFACTGVIGGGDGPGDDDDGDNDGATVDADPGPPPDEADCHAWLDYLGVAYTLGPEAMGVENPVTATMPIAGIAYRTVGGDAPRETMFGDCAIIRSLGRAATILAEHEVTEVTDYGVYNYRCIGGGAPPCSRGVSQHAYGTAIDIAGFTRADGSYASVNDDWVIDPESQKTCEAATVEGKDRFLHEVICQLDAANTWNIILTPNYNADHRNHFHVDLTPDSNLTNRALRPPDHH